MRNTTFPSKYGARWSELRAAIDACGMQGNFRVIGNLARGQPVTVEFQFVEDAVLAKLTLG